MTDDRGQRSIDTLRALGDDGEALFALGDLGRIIVEFAYGDIYTRPGLSLRDRTLATVAMLSVLDRPVQLRSHLHRALAAGVTAQELEEVIVQGALYGGFPAAIEAVKLLQAVLAEGAPPP